MRRGDYTDAPMDLAWMAPAGVTRVDVGTGRVANSASVVLEKLARLNPAALPADRMLARFEGELSVEHVQSVDPDILENTRDLGERRHTQRPSCVLCVPSVIVPEERNLVLKPPHPEAAHMSLIRERPFSFDGRQL